MDISITDTANVADGANISRLMINYVTYIGYRTIEGRTQLY